MKTFAQFFLKIMYPFLIVNYFFKIEKIKWTSQLAGLLRNLRIHIEFHSKLLQGLRMG